MIITSITQLPYPPYRVTNMKHINYVVSISDINHTKYVHPCEQLRRWHRAGLHTGHEHYREYFADVWYPARDLQFSNGTVEVEYEYI
jgi:hypothetical protein